MTGIAAPRTIPLHGSNRIDNRQVGGTELVDFQENPGKELPVKTRLKMPCRLGSTDQDTEKIFHPAGQGHHLMGFQFGQVDNPVSIKISSGNLEPPELTG